MLTVYIDFKSPACYLALLPTLALAEKYQVDIEWRAFKTVERPIPKLAGREELSLRHNQVRDLSKRKLFEKYAERQGIDLKFPSRSQEPSLALAVLNQLSAKRTDFVKLAFKAFWEAHENLDDADVVKSLLGKCGLPQDSFDEDKVRQQYDRDLEKAYASGIVEAPAYFIDQQLFIGREHFPWIEEILNSKTRFKDK
ncbi:DsbA family protein [Kordiimonas sp. SCSIO 12610]|uniref:DsbA family protein n=1 Tax=Kordiimonas sp. SCSIO 12610 TaxID=2829597 RepID=UPI002109D921|nr:DsbA family protein [Kordiimonas sp. SCSIO 12610]UTW54369.1 DsbA family protein [Kordiimonas sp. SCSIO 12610]